MCTLGKFEFPLPFLQSEGFNPNLCTAYRFQPTGTTSFHCYDIEYIIDEQETLIILTEQKERRYLIA